MRRFSSWAPTRMCRNSSTWRNACLGMNGTKKREQLKAAPSFQIADKIHRSRHSAAAADPPDVGGGDLRRNAHGHGAAVFNAHALTHGKAAGPGRVYQDLLTSAHSRSQQHTRRIFALSVVSIGVSSMPVTSLSTGLCSILCGRRQEVPGRRPPFGYLQNR